MISCHGIRHDGSRIGVDQSHNNSLFPKGSGGLRTRIIELTGLTNDDRT